MTAKQNKKTEQKKLLKREITLPQDNSKKFTFTIKDYVILLLNNAITELSNKKKDVSEYLEILNFINSNVVEFKIKKQQTNFVINYTLLDNGKGAETTEKIEQYLKGKLRDVFMYLIHNLHHKQDNEQNKTFNVAGHLKDQMLKYTYPKEKQPTLLDTLSQDTIKEIEKRGVKREEIVEGINLTPSQIKVIDSLCKLLHFNSQTTASHQKDYYIGNKEPNISIYGKEETLAPKLAFTIYELAKEYKGGEYVGGKDIENVKQILTELNEKSFLLSYVETTFKRDGGRIEKKIEEFRKLINIIKLSETEYNKDNIELSKKEETVVTLNPIFRRQIDSKFIKYPIDINRKTIIAYGSHNLSEIALRLRDYLIREHSYKRYTAEMTIDKLYYFVAEKWMKESRKKKVKEYLDKALKTVINLGLLNKYEIKPGKTGELKIVFYINESWG